MQLFTSPYVSYQMYTSLGPFQHRFALTGALQIIFPLQRNICHNYTIYITLHMVNYNTECYVITLYYNSPYVSAICITPHTPNNFNF
jgi:hypothetical protein